LKVDSLSTFCTAFTVVLAAGRIVVFITVRKLKRFLNAVEREDAKNFSP